MSDAPAQLKKELDTILGLQADLDTTDQAIQATKSAIEKQTISNHTLEALSSLERSHERLMDKVEALYASLNVAIGSFFEWDKLDQAVGRAQKALGTKLHQRTRKAIAKRQPALMAAIRKYNTYCTQLKDLHDPAWLILLPKPLPTKLNDLRNHESLMEDIWISLSIGEIPHWMNDPAVREGIHAMLKRDRCLEEQRRLGMEADSLCRWYGNELAAVVLALRIPESKYIPILEFTTHDTSDELILLPLRYRHEQLLTLPHRWSNSLVSKSHFDWHTKEAEELAMRLTYGFPETSLSWLTPTIIEAPESSGEELQMSIELEIGTEATIESEDLITLDYLVEEMLDTDTHDAEETNNKYVITGKIVWSVPSHFTVDSTLPPTLPESGTRIVFDRINGVRRQTFNPEDIGMLASPTSCINDVCINGCILLLLLAINPLQARHFAIFSTFDLLLARHKADGELFQAAKHTNFWMKDVWILPIYRPGHWVLCVADFTRRELRLFDSLAEEKPWRSDVMEIMNFMSHLLSVANTTIPEVRVSSRPWRAYPITVNQ
ncbi:hypothetical protein JVT61DRAFT_9514 [Boletus reticuloceps]|uniref:Ubiquitin-like protease family profile domain-containing protein n=1 Tax=Boletus reticuloceps TaxID=495285 RepID=A0A8I3A6F3_9AGAM|nr:hypothetical protein JVT61DRAFT_9514 [Boletus reticuloceps]